MLGKKKKISKRITIVLIVAIVILLLLVFSFTLRGDRKLNPVESFIRDTMGYVGRVVMVPFDFIKEMVIDYKNLYNTLEENERLKSSIDRSESLESENAELRRELDKLKEELDIDYTLTDYEYLNATVISRNVGYWYNTITIDKGTYNGVDKDMAVINAKGLIGKVIRTTTFTSDIRLLTTSDTNNKISVSVSNGGNHLYGVINGYNYTDNVLQLEGISNTKNVEIDDFVYTSGLGGVFPSGILIGKVSAIKTDSYDLGKIIMVTPSVDFTDINYVSVLKRKSVSE